AAAAPAAAADRPGPRQAARGAAPRPDEIGGEVAWGRPRRCAPGGVGRRSGRGSSATLSMSAALVRRGGGTIGTGPIARPRRRAALGRAHVGGHHLPDRGAAVHGRPPVNGRSPGARPEGGAIVRTCRDEWPRVVGALVRAVGDLDVAEDAAQEAFAAAADPGPTRCRRRSTPRTATPAG